MANNDMGTSPTDQSVIDAIATYMGTMDRWNPADMVETIADLIGQVRPHPGHTWDGDVMTDAETYVYTFGSVTGREAPAKYDMHDA